MDAFTKEKFTALSNNVEQQAFEVSCGCSDSGQSDFGPEFCAVLFAGGHGFDAPERGLSNVALRTLHAVPPQSEKTNTTYCTDSVETWSSINIYKGNSGSCVTEISIKQAVVGMSETHIMFDKKTIYNNGKQAKHVSGQTHGDITGSVGCDFTATVSCVSVIYTKNTGLEPCDTAIKQVNKGKFPEGGQTGGRVGLSAAPDGFFAGFRTRQWQTRRKTGTQSHGAKVQKPLEKTSEMGTVNYAGRAAEGYASGQPPGAPRT